MSGWEFWQACDFSLLVIWLPCFRLHAHSPNSVFANVQLGVLINISAFIQYNSYSPYN